MNGLRIGSLCSGYGGLELGVQAVLGGSTAWVSDIDKGACKILAHRFPGVPNIGDMTAVDWSAVEPVDLICGGTPCQDLSHAGKRAGMTEGTRSNLWVSMREAIAVIRPKYVVWENVRGAASAEADSDLVNDPRLLAGVRRRAGQPVLRALGRVVGDLADLGYVGQLRGLRAADVGAPHGRFRYFILAADNDGRRREVVAQLNRHSASTATDGASRRGHADGRPSPALLPSPRTSDTNGAGHHGDGGLDLRTAVALLGTPRASEWKGVGPVGSKSYNAWIEQGYLSAQVLSLLPTPAVNDMGAGKSVEEWDAWTERMKAEHRNGNGNGASLSIEAARLLPTPNAKMAEGSQTHRSGARSDELLIDGIVAANAWGQYAAAIRRWESLTRPAPPPTEPGAKGNPRLSAAFSEWMMGLPAGWVTDVPGITRNEALRALGNGVVPQQCAAALAEMLSWSEAVA